MKKFFHCVLIFSIAFSTITLSSYIPTVAASSLTNNLDPSDVQESYSEAFELNGVKFFYEDNENYTLTITKALNGEESIAYLDKHGINGQILVDSVPNTTNVENSLEDISDENMEMKPLSVFDAKRFAVIKNEVLNNTIVLEKVSFDEFGSIKDISGDYDSGTLATSSISKINYSLAKTYGAQYTAKYLTSLLKDGYKGYLYQHMNFGASPKTSFLFNALTAIGVIATMVSTPASGLIGIASWSSAVGGAYTLRSKTEFNTWNAKVYIQKEVKVGTVYPYRAFYDRGLTAVTGSQGYAALSSVKSTYKSSDFDSNTSILNTGINNYIKFYR